MSNDSIPLYRDDAMSGAALDATLSTKTEEGASMAAMTTETRKISPWLIIPVWISLSASVILLNKYLFSHLNFPYPVFLTTYHMAFATIGTQLLRHTTSLLNKIDESPLTLREWSRTIVPLGLAFSLSLVLSNLAYVMLSVSFVQMLKAFIPVLVHLFSCMIGVAVLDVPISVILAMISVGCVVAAAGEIHASFWGLVCQLAAITVESARLVMIQLLLNSRKMDPLVSIYYYAPVCLVCIAIAQPIIEGWAPFVAFSNVGLPMLLLNGTLAFSLNVAGVFLIDAAGSLVLTLSGVLKDVLLITFSVTLLSSHITPVQVGGYALTLSGLITFKLKDNAQLHGYLRPLAAYWDRLRSNGAVSATNSQSFQPLPQTDEEYDLEENGSIGKSPSEHLLEQR